MDNLVQIHPGDDSPAAAVVRNVCELIDTCGCQAQVNLDFGPGLAHAVIEHEAGCDWLTIAAVGDPVLIVIHRRQHEEDAAA